VPPILRKYREKDSLALPLEKSSPSLAYYRSAVGTWAGVRLTRTGCWCMNDANPGARSSIRAL